MNQWLFFLVILLANIIQGITGFAGTILAMPFSIRLVGYETAKPVLNVLGLLAGIYVVAGGRKDVNLRELKRVSICMAIGILLGILVRSLMVGREHILYLCLGIFVIGIGLKGLITTWVGMHTREDAEQKNTEDAGANPDPPKFGPASAALLTIAGVVHGIFVSGGPLIISYLTSHTKDKNEFRRTVSAVWIILNGMILVSDVMAGYYTAATIRTQLISIPFLFGGMYIGSLLFRRMNQKFFMILTYVLLMIAGGSLLLK